MKKAFSNLTVRKKLELLNLSIGFVLILIAITYLSESNIESFAGWFIFGCMYIVMDKYWSKESYSNLRLKADVFKYLINITALVVSISFLVYIILN